MQNVLFAAEASWQVLLVGLILGAGLPALFAVGIRSLAWGTAHETTGELQTHPLGRVIAYLCFAVVILAVLMGIAVVVAGGFGMSLDFSHGFPTFAAKH
jgi:succinate dehydrogenase/fumarate reductase cytochrome b subunit